MEPWHHNLLLATCDGLRQVNAETNCLFSSGMILDHHWFGGRVGVLSLRGDCHGFQIIVETDASETITLVHSKGLVLKVNPGLLVNNVNTSD